MADKLENGRRTILEQIMFKRKVLRLLKSHGLTEIAKILGVQKQIVYKIRQGTYLKDIETISLESLELRRSSGKLCRVCGEPVRFFCKSYRCLQCEVEWLISQQSFILPPTIKE